MYVGCIDIVLAGGAQFIDQLIACYHAELIDFCFIPDNTKVLPMSVSPTERLVIGRAI